MKNKGNSKQNEVEQKLAEAVRQNEELARCNAILAEHNQELTETIQRFCGITDELFGLVAQMMTAAELDGLSPLFTSIKNMADKTKGVFDAE